MRVKLDENVPDVAIALFTAAGHDVETVLTEGMVGHPDEDIWSACGSERRMLVTFDLGFGDIRAYPPGSHPGVIVLRLADQRPDAVAETVGRFLAGHDLDEFAGCLLVVSGTEVRLRRG